MKLSPRWLPLLLALSLGACDDDDDDAPQPTDDAAIELDAATLDGTAGDATVEVDFGADVGVDANPDAASPQDASADAEVDAAPVTPLPLAGEVVFTEIMYDPHGVLEDDFAEWFEVRNRADHAVALGGCFLGDDDPAHAQPLAALELAAGEVALFVRSDDAAVNGGLVPDALFDFGLNNGGDALELRCGDVEVDAVTFSDEAPWPMDARQRSIQVGEAEEAENDEPMSWCFAEVAYYAAGDQANAHLGSPGAVNPACAARPACDPSPCNAPPETDCADATHRQLYPEQGACAEVEGRPVCSYEGVAEACADGRVCEGGACIAPDLRMPEAGELVVTEIMYDPHGPLEDDLAEWFEVHNPTADALDLAGCDLTDDDPAHLAAISPTSIGPGAYAVFARSADPAVNGGLAPAATFDFGLSNGGDTIAITCGGVEIVTVSYDDAEPWPLDASARSISLDPGASAEDGASWCFAADATVYYVDAVSADENHRGTPGLPNPACP